jgi:hypothetical protein
MVATAGRGGEAPQRTLEFDDGEMKYTSWDSLYIQTAESDAC